MPLFVVSQSAFSPPDNFATIVVGESSPRQKTEKIKSFRAVTYRLRCEKGGTEMDADEIQALVQSMQIPRPPASAADAIKLQWLTLQLLQSIAISLATQAATNSK